MKIGSIVLKYPVIQAPLSGYSDYTMRTVSRDCGAELTFAGLMLDKSAAHPKVIRKPAFMPGKDEHPVGAQIHGTDPKVMAKAAHMLEDVGYDIIDLNFACPARKVLLRGRGGALLQDPQTVREIFLAVRSNVKCPVGIKLRSGFDSSQQSQDNFWTICENAAKDGADFITIHGRTVSSKYRGKANWQIIKQVKQSFNDTLIFGSGDLFEPDDCVDKMFFSGADGLSIARGAIGNPWIFEQIQAVLDGKQPPEKPSLQEQAAIIKKHLDMIFELFNDRKVVGYFRKFISRYAILHPDRKKATMDIIAADSKTQLYAALKRWYPM